jgi:hypothetical protein
MEEENVLKYKIKYLLAEIIGLAGPAVLSSNYFETSVLLVFYYVCYVTCVKTWFSNYTQGIIQSLELQYITRLNHERSRTFSK